MSVDRARRFLALVLGALYLGLCGAMVIAVLLAATAGDALAQPCEPKGFGNAAAPGSPVVLHITTRGAAGAWWCPGSKPGTWRGAWYGGTWSDAAQFAAVVAPRVLAASSPWAAFRAEAAAVSMPPAGSAAECRVRELQHGACLRLYTTSAAPYPGPFSAAQATAPARCGPAPNCDGIVVPPPVLVWRTPAGGSSIFPVSAGRLGVPISGRRAPGAALCDLSVLRIAVGSYTYGALAGGPATEAVVCVQVPQ